MGLVDYLIQRGALSPAQRERVLALTAERKESEPVILTRLGLVSEREMAAALADHLDLKLADPAAFPERPLLAERIAPGFLQRSRVLPIAEGSDRLVLAMADPTDAAAVEAVRLLVGKPIERRVACPSDTTWHSPVFMAAAGRSIRSSLRRTSRQPSSTPAIASGSRTSPATSR